MSFLNTEQLAREIEADYLVIPYDKNRIKQGAYELSVAGEYYHTAMTDGKQIAEKGKQVIIPPGQLGLLITEETIAIPKNRIGLISIKFSKKIRGLINVSGFHVDPGFRGKLKFSVYNAGSRDVILEQSCPLFTLWMATLTEPETEATKYNGEHLNQSKISDRNVEDVQGTIASPGSLLKEIERINSELRIYRIFGGLIAAVTLAALIVPAYKWATDYWMNAAQPATNTATQGATNPGD